MCHGTDRAPRCIFGHVIDLNWFDWIIRRMMTDASLEFISPGGGQTFRDQQKETSFDVTGVAVDLV
jgi:hypothetical protein